MFDCFITTFSLGIRLSGGIGDKLYEVSLDDQPKYWIRKVYDVLFFIVVVIMLLNIIFGIIIDTFAQIRDDKKKILEDI